MVPSLRAKPQRCPVYLVIDSSGSMQGLESTVEVGIRNIVDELKKNRQVGEVAALSVITYSDSPHDPPAIPLTRVSQITDIPKIHADGCTMTGSALAYVTQMAKNELVLESQNGLAADFRPLLVLMTDGYASDQSDLMNGINQMRSYKWGDWLILGCGEANEQELETIGGKNHWIRIESLDPATLQTFFRLITKTIKSSVEHSKTSHGNKAGLGVAEIVQEANSGAALINAPTDALGELDY